MILFNSTNPLMIPDGYLPLSWISSWIRTLATSFQKGLLTNQINANEFKFSSLLLIFGICSNAFRSVDLLLFIIKYQIFFDRLTYLLSIVDKLFSIYLWKWRMRVMKNHWILQIGRTLNFKLEHALIHVVFYFFIFLKKKLLVYFCRQSQRTKYFTTNSLSLLKNKTK